MRAEHRAESQKLNLGDILNLNGWWNSVQDARIVKINPKSDYSKKNEQINSAVSSQKRST